MTLNTRRIITAIFIAVFAVLTPLVILYTAGYTYNFAKHKVEKTGLIILAFRPASEDFSVLVNGQPAKTAVKDADYIRIRNLLPNIYNIKLIKEGFHPWEKNIEVKNNLTTFATDIVVFQDNLPIQLHKDKMIDVNISDNKERIAYVIPQEIGNEIWAYDLKNEKNKLLYRASPKNNDLDIIGWGPGNEKILAKASGNFFTLDFSEPQNIYLLRSITSRPFQSLTWDNFDNNILYGLSEGVLYKINISNNSLHPQTKLESEKFIIDKNNVYYLKANKEKSYLAKKSIETSDEEIITSELPMSDSLQFLKTDNGFITISDLEKENLYIINPSIKNDLLKLDGKGASWQGKKLLFYNDFEIWIYDLETAKKELVRRQSNTIKKAIWYPDRRHVIYLDEDIHITEISSAEVSNNITLVSKFKGIEDVICDNAGENIYFIGAINSHTGLYELKIFEE